MLFSNIRTVLARSLGYSLLTRPLGTQRVRANRPIDQLTAYIPLPELLPELLLMLIFTEALPPLLRMVLWIELGFLTGCSSPLTIRLPELVVPSPVVVLEELTWTSNDEELVLITSPLSAPASAGEALLELPKLVSKPVLLLMPPEPAPTPSRLLEVRPKANKATKANKKTATKPRISFWRPDIDSNAWWLGIVKLFNGITLYPPG